MGYHIDVFNSWDPYYINVREKVTQLMPGECDVSIHQKINGEYMLRLFYPKPVHSWQEDKTSLLTPYVREIRLIDEDDSSAYRSFAKVEGKTTHNEDGAMGYEMLCEHVSIHVLNSEILATEFDFIEASVSDAITSILSYANWFMPGTIDTDKKVTLKVGYETLMSAIMKVVKASATEYVCFEPNYIDVYDRVGDDATTKQIMIREGLNLKGVELTKFSGKIVNVMYGVGGGYPASTIAGARHVVLTDVGDGANTIGVDHNQLLVEDNCLSSHKCEVLTGSAAGSYTITTAYRGDDGRDTINVTPAPTGIADGDKIEIRGTSNEPLVALWCTRSVNDYGYRYGVYKNQKYRGVINLVESSALDDTYSSGRCANWSLAGTPTLSENTNTDYITYGSSSQRVQGAADGDGISQDISTTSGDVYRLLVWVYITSGTVKVTIGSYDLPSKSGSGWQRFEFVGVASGSSTTISITQDGAGSSDFYIDAVMFAEGEDSKSFVKNCDQLELWKKTCEVARTKLDPTIEYICSFVDLNDQYPELYPDEKINIGDTVLITDENIGIENVELRVKEVTFYPFSPEKTIYRVNNT